MKESCFFFGVSFESDNLEAKAEDYGLLEGTRYASFEASGFWRAYSDGRTSESNFWLWFW